MKTEVSVTSTITGWAGRFRGKLTQLYLFTAAQMQTNRGMLFIHSGSYNGHEVWPKLKLRDGQPLRDHGTLMQSIGPQLKMKNGVRPVVNKGTILRYGSDKVTIGTDLKYARLMNDGGTIVPKNGKVLWIPLPEGKRAQEHVIKATKGIRKGKSRQSPEHLGGAPIVRLKNGKFFMLAKKVVVPPRPFDKLNAQDKAEIKEALTNEVARCLNE